MNTSEQSSANKFQSIRGNDQVQINTDQLDVWKLAVIGSAVALTSLAVVILTAVCWFLQRRRRKQHQVNDSIYSLSERWDSLSLSYGDVSNEFWKCSSDELANDGYLACLDREIARRTHAYRNPMVNSCELPLDRVN